VQEAHAQVDDRISEGVMEILNSGALYIHGRDKLNHPVGYMRCSIMKNFSDKQLDDLVKAGFYLSAFAQRHLLVSGRTEQMVMIIDFEDCSYTQVPWRTVIKFI
jgi:hypothetical protein